MTAAAALLSARGIRTGALRPCRLRSLTIRLIQSKRAAILSGCASSERTARMPILHWQSVSIGVPRIALRSILGSPGELVTYGLRAGRRVLSQMFTVCQCDWRTVNFTAFLTGGVTCAYLLPSMKWTPSKGMNTPTSGASHEHPDNSSVPPGTVLGLR